MPLPIPLNNDVAPSIANALMTGQPAPSYLPVYATLALSLLFVIVVLLVFQRQEL